MESKMYSETGQEALFRIVYTAMTVVFCYLLFHFFPLKIFGFIVFITAFFGWLFMSIKQAKYSFMYPIPPLLFGIIGLLGHFQFGFTIFGTHFEPAAYFYATVAGVLSALYFIISTRVYRHHLWHVSGIVIAAVGYCWMHYHWRFWIPGFLAHPFSITTAKHIGWLLIGLGMFLSAWSLEAFIRFRRETRLLKKILKNDASVRRSDLRGEIWNYKETYNEITEALCEFIAAQTDDIEILKQAEQLQMLFSLHSDPAVRIALKRLGDLKL